MSASTPKGQPVLYVLDEEDLTPETDPATTAECEPHTPRPAGYLNWHAWAEEMSKTHKQRKCKGCGLYKIWDPKPTTKEKALHLLSSPMRVGYQGEVQVLEQAAKLDEAAVPWQVKALIDARYSATLHVEQKEATRLAKNKRRLDRRYQRKHGHPHPHAGGM